MADGHAGEEPDPLDAFRQFFALQGEVLVLSLAMFAFSLGFQMTGRYLPQYLSAVGAGSVVIGLYGSVGNLISAVYPYTGGGRLALLHRPRAGVLGRDRGGTRRRRVLPRSG